jgi:soluble lytic murein transglycosylase-like protein
MVLTLCLILAGCSGKVAITLPPTNPWKEVEAVPAVVETYHGVPVPILDRLIQSESSWYEGAVNRSNGEHSVGLAQVNLRWLPYYRQRYGLQDPMRPVEALDFAARYLWDLYKQTGSWYEAVLAYKCGLAGRHRAPERIKRIASWVAGGKTNE